MQNPILKSIFFRPTPEILDNPEKCSSAFSEFSSASRKKIEFSDLESAP